MAVACPASGLRSEAWTACFWCFGRLGLDLSWPDVAEFVRSPPNMARPDVVVSMRAGLGVGRLDADLAWLGPLVRPDVEGRSRQSKLSCSLPRFRPLSAELGDCCSDGDGKRKGLFEVSKSGRAGVAQCSC